MRLRWVALLATSACVGETTVVDRVASSLGRDGFTPVTTFERLAGSERLAVRRLWSGSQANFYSSSPSPDGRFLAQRDRESGDLALLDLDTNFLRRLTDMGEGRHDFAAESVFSPDGRRIAYGWYDQGRRGNGVYELRVIDLNGAEPRVVFRDSDNVASISPEAWSPDGTSILATLLFHDGTQQISLISVDDGSVRALKRLDAGYPAVMSFSPDGRYVVYDLPAEGDEGPRDIFVTSAEGGAQRGLVTGPGDDRLLGWWPSRDLVLFHSDRSGTPSIWAVRVEAGRSAGEPLLVRSDVWSLEPLGFAGDRYLYGVTVEQAQVHTAAIDLASGTVLGPSTPVQLPSAGGSYAADWSRDGRYLAYVAEGPGPGARLQLVIRSASDNHEVRRQPLDFKHVTHIRWGPDGESFLVNGEGRSNRTGLFVLDIDTGELTAVTYLTGGSDELQSPDWSRDGRHVFFVRYGETYNRGLLMHELATGRDSEIHPNGRLVGVSPDGSRVAYVFGRGVQRLVVRPTLGGDPDELVTLDRPEHFDLRAGLAWTPDGGALLVSWGTSAKDSALWLVPVGAGEPPRKLPLPPGRDMRIHPDGRRIAYGAGSFRGEVWVLETLSAVAETQETYGSR